jgi:NTP pyrophosphatase (non-canonical NTP hydrolase)
MSKLHGLAEQAETSAIARGFDPCIWENMPGKIAFVLTEVVEACESVTSSRADLIEELADIALRTLAILHGVYGNDWCPRNYSTNVGSTFESMPVLLYPIARNLGNAVNWWRDDAKLDAKVCLEYVISELYSLATNLGEDLTQAIIRKSTKNADRPKLHGHVRSLG